MTFDRCFQARTGWNSQTNFRGKLDQWRCIIKLTQWFSFASRRMSSGEHLHQQNRIITSQLLITWSRGRGFTFLKYYFWSLNCFLRNIFFLRLRINFSGYFLWRLMWESGVVTRSYFHFGIPFGCSALKFVTLRWRTIQRSVESFLFLFNHKRLACFCSRFVAECLQ